MKSAKSLGRIIGILLFVQLAGLIVPFVLLHPMTGTDFLANAAASGSQVKLAVLLLLANCALTIGISIAAFPVFREYSPATAVLPVALSVLMFALQAVDNAHLMAMLSLSQEYVQKGGSDELFQTLSAVVRAARRWVHYSELIVIDSWIFVLYAALYRFSLVPRALSVFGMATVLLHFAAIPLPLILGYGGITPLGALMAVSHITLATWLAVKGFKSENYV
ncbi:MAG TPA: DUF4386 domain-containing protein [Pyrinomonadaceae bacterium]|jgi:hypothetical protein